MRVLVLQHIDSEGPGTLGEYLEESGVDLETVRLNRGEPLPGNHEGLAGIVSMGGPMNVYEEQDHPYLKDETDFLRNAIEAGVPTVGVCLGAQMIAKACSAAVVKSPREEIGWSRVTITDHGRDDPLFNGLPGTMDVFQWHGDMFEVPENGQLTATGDDCPNQAFRFKNAFALQFHVEVTEGILSEWFKGSPELPGMLNYFRERESSLIRQADTIYGNLLELMR